MFIVGSFGPCFRFRELTVSEWAREMIEKRRAHRRFYQAHTDFPLFNCQHEIIESERRCCPTRRVNDITVAEIDCSEFISEIAKQD